MDAETTRIVYITGSVIAFLLILYVTRTICRHSNEEYDYRVFLNPVNFLYVASIIIFLVLLWAISTGNQTATHYLMIGGIALIPALVAMVLNIRATSASFGLLITFLQLVFIGISVLAALLAIVAVSDRKR